MNLLVLLFIAFPTCLAQFSIQGPSDGNRVAQGLRIEEGKGIEYTDQNESQEGGFSIQGASDGHSQIQGGTDGHSNFQIEGARHGGAERYNFQGPTTGAYNIQGATDGHSQSFIQGSYDGNSGSSKSLQYNDPSGLRVNWKSYEHSRQPAAQQEVQYSEPAVASAPRATHRQRGHALRQPQPQPQPQPQHEPIALQQSKSLDNAPTHIRQLLQLQQQLPYVNIIPEPFRYENLLASQPQQEPQYHGNQQQQQQQQPQYHTEYQEQPAPEPRRPSYRGKPRGPPRHRRQAPNYRPEANARSQQQYRRAPPQSTEPQIRYSSNLPPQLQQLLKFQAQTPYINSIPEPFRFNPEPAAQMQIQQVRSYYQDLLRQQPTSPVVHSAPPATAPAQVRRPPQEQEHSRQRRQAPHRQQSQLQRQTQLQRQPQPQQLPAEPVPQYSTNLPGYLQNLLKYQSQIPYNIIANQINYRPEKPYVPQPVQSSAPQVRYQGESGGGDGYQGQSSGYEQVYASQSEQQYTPQYNPQYNQAQFGYQQSDRGVRPVTEN